MKKTITIILAIILLSLSACVGNPKTVGNSKETDDPILKTAIENADNWVTESGESVKDYFAFTGTFDKDSNTYNVVMQSNDEDTDFKLTHETYEGQFKQFPQSMFEKISSFFEQTNVSVTVTMNKSNGEQIYCFSDSK